MFKLITAGALADLVQRAETAETSLADANRKLADLTARQELALEREGEAAELRKELAAVNVCLRQRDADGESFRLETNMLLAACDRTIAELGAELKLVRADRPAGPELPERTVLTFRTVGGGLVALIATSGPCNYGYQCLTCGDEAGGAYSMENARRWANEHAAECRAIPPAVVTRT
ncbi:hypothetical protein ACFVUN_34535 [Kitasatospora griseola]|uniref:hypothetical protein n=1 Tax=Kitasatospora griseola TaxID=2064 RepID=UPI0036DB8A52